MLVNLLICLLDYWLDILETRMPILLFLILVEIFRKDHWQIGIRLTELRQIKQRYAHNFIISRIICINQTIIL